MASRLQDVILRGLSSAKPLATAVAPGTLYHSADTAVTERSNGTIWEDYSDGGSGGGGGSIVRSFGCDIDGQGAPITTGFVGSIPSLPFTGSITRVRITADQVGDIEIDIRIGTFASYPTVASICASALPTLSGARKSEDTTLTGWDLTIAAGDCAEFHVISAADVEKVSLLVEVLT